MAKEETVSPFFKPFIDFFKPLRDMFGPLNEWLSTDAGMTLGKSLFVGVYVLLLIWLLLIPKHRLGHKVTPPLWRNARAWAVVICIVQIGVYFKFS